jgi:hypothetical protein
MQAVSLAAGAAAMVAVPLALYLAWASNARRRRDRKVSERRRSADTAIRLTEGGRERSRSSGGKSKSRSRRPRSKEPSIDLFKSRSAESAPADGPKEADPKKGGG